MERETSLIANYQQVFNLLGENGERTGIIPIGRVQYAQGTKALLMGVNQKGGLDCTFEEYSEPLPPVERNNGQVLDLSDYDLVLPIQVTIATLEIRTHSSIRQKLPSLSAELFFQLPVQTGNTHEQPLPLNETQILDIMLGQDTGLAVFYSNGQPEENALILENVTPNPKNAVIVFFHPDETAKGLNSVNGIRHFFGLLNDAFINNSRVSPAVLRAFAGLDKNLATGVLHEPPARVEIVKANLIARSLTADSDKTQRTQLQVDLALIGATSPLLRPGFSVNRYRSKVSAFFGQTINHLLINQEEIDNGEVRVNDYQRLELRSQKGKKLFQRYLDEMGFNFGLDDGNEITKSMMRQYLKDIVSLVTQADTYEELRDASVLMDDLSKLPCAKETTIDLDEVAISSENVLSTYFRTNGRIGDLWYGKVPFTLSFVVSCLQPYITELKAIKFAETSK